MIVGDDLSEEERKHRWLSSPLLAGGMEADGAATAQDEDAKAVRWGGGQGWDGVMASVSRWLSFLLDNPFLMWSFLKIGTCFGSLIFVG